MRGNKRLVQSIAVAGAAGVLVFSVTFSQPQIMQTEETIQITQNGTAGILETSDMGQISPDQNVTVEKHDVYRVAAAVPAEEIIKDMQAARSGSSASDSLEKKETSSGTQKQNTKIKEEKETTEKTEKETKTKKETKTTTKITTEKGSETENKAKTEKETKTETKKEQKKTQEENEAELKAKIQAAIDKKWGNKLMADVDDSLNIRESSSEDAKIVGKLRKGDVAKVIKKGKAWTKIKSGSVTGYVKNEYCVYKTKAYKLAKKICGTYASVQADALRIRSKSNKKSSVLDVAYKGDKLEVNTKAKAKDGWVVVKLDDKKGYVSEEYVDVALETGKAISIEEEMAQIAAQKKAEEEKARAAAQSVSSTSSASVPASNTVTAAPAASGDLTLLSAIIYCEAGGESYAGQVAVGAVVMNRVRSGSFPNSISGVVYQSGQFSPVANGSLSKALSNGNYQHCMAAARAALAGSDNTGGAKYFHRANGAAGLVIGHHVFY